MRRRPRLWVFAAIVSAVVSTLAANAQRAQPERETVQADLKRFHGLIHEYRTGSDRPVDEVLTQNQRRIHGIVNAIETALDDVRPWEESRFAAAVMIYTDAAIRLIDESDSDRALVFLDAATQLLHKARPRLQRFSGAWGFALARLLRNRGWITVEEWFLDLGRERLPEDSRLLDESGELQELLATFIEIPQEPPPPPTMSGHITGARPIPPGTESVRRMKQEQRRRLDLAARFLKQSLRIQEANRRTQLHLGRVLTLLNELTDARANLSEARKSEEREVRYLAALFAGALFQRSGDLKAAADSYRSAIRELPSSQAAFTGLSSVLLAAGQSAEAMSTARQAVAETTRGREDPWWTYQFEASEFVTRRVTDLRTEARR
jgi:tetratricopeptide (TPR) repeat protein